MKGKIIIMTMLMTATVLAVLLAGGSAIAGPPAQIAATPVSTAGPGVKIFLPLVMKNLTAEMPPTRLALLRWVKHGEVRIDRGETYDRAGAYAPAIVSLPNGTYRMYYSGFDGVHSRILSAISSDGRTWTKEAGVRVNIWGPYVAVYSPEVIRLPNGTYRMYFSARSADPLYANIHSAFSADGLSWQVMSGIRIQHGGTFDSVLAQNPSVVQNPDGSPFLYPDGRYRMYYAGFDGSHFRILSASSQDGLTWQKEKIRLDFGGRHAANQVTDPEIVQLPDGSFRLFYAGSNGTAFAQAYDADPQPSPQSSPADVPLDGYVILSAWSADGMEWVREKGTRLTRGDAGRPDSAHVFSPAVARMGDSYRLFYTANDGLVSLIMDTRVLPADAYILRNFRTRRVSIAQVEVTVDYNVSAFLPSMQPNLFITAAVLQQGVKLSSFGIPFDPISPTIGTAKFLIEYFGDKPKTSDEIQVTLWAKTGELCPNPNVPPCYPVGFDAYSEQFDVGLGWLPGTGGTLRVLDIYEALPQQPAVPSGPYLNARILYSYYNVWGTGALVDLEFYDEHGKMEEFETVPVPIYPNKDTRSDGAGTGVVRVPARYMGTNQKSTTSLKATLRSGYLASPMVEATKPYRKTWNPPAVGVIRSVRREQPVSHQANFIVDYDYTPLPGIDLPARVSASVLKGGSLVQTNFKSSPAPLVAGRGRVTVTVNYTGDQAGYTTDQVRLEMSIPDLILDDSTQNWPITWNPRETGRLSLAPIRGAIQEPIPNGAELEVDLQYTYRSRGATRATIRIQAMRKGATDGRLPVVEATVSPAEDARQTLKLRYTAADRNLVSDQLRLTMVSQTTGEILDERVMDWAKTWNPPTTGRINAITVEQVTSWKARITVKYDYDSPVDEPAWLSARWYVRYTLPQPPWYRDEPRLFFDQTRAPLEEGRSKEATFFVFYTGSMYDLMTNLVKVYMYAGREQRSLTDNELGSVIWWSPPPVGSLGVARVDSQDDRHIKVQANYSLLAGQCQNPTLRVEVWKNGLIGPLPDFQGNTPIQCTGSISNVLSVTATVAYTGEVPFLNTHLLMLKMLVNGVLVELEGGKDFRLEYEYEKEWYVTPVGEMAEPRVTWISPRELALQVDYGYTSAATLRPSIKLLRNGEDVTARFEIDIFPGVIVIPVEGKAGSLAARIRYRDDYLEELVTDQIEVRLKNSLGQTKVAGLFTEVLDWQHFETEEYRVAYHFQNLRIERPDGTTIVAHMDFANPIRNDPHLILKPFLWRNNIPVLPVSQDDPNYADHSEFPFNYITATIGIALYDTVEIVYTKPVGEFQFDAIGFVLYEHSSNVPLYSRTFPFADPAEGHIAAPDDILGIELVTGLAADEQTGQIEPSTNFIWNSGELWAMVTYAVNSDVAGMKIWPSEFYPGTAAPYYPYELVGQQSIPAEKGLGLATFKFRLLDSYVDYDFLLDNTITWPGFRGDGIIEFNLGVPGQEPPMVRKGTSGSRDNYDQAADLRRPVGSAKPFPNQIELFNIDYVLPPTSGYEPPVYLGAVALKDGEPVQGLSMMPVVITNTGKGRVTSDAPIILSFNSSDVATNTVSSDEVMLIMFAAEGEEGAPFYRETFPYVSTWTRTSDSVSVSSCESLPATATEPPRIRVVTRYTYTDASAQRVAGYGGVAKLWAEGLQLSEPVGAYSPGLTLDRPGSGTAALTVELEEGIVARTTHVAVYMESFIRSNRGEIRQEGLAQTVVECRSLLVNENAFVVATLEEIEILDDGDTVTPVGEVMLATLGATSPEVTESNRWPIEITNARWHEVHDTDDSQRVLHPNFPFFTRRLYQMGPVLGLYVGAIEDDSMPSWVGTLISVVAKAGALVANCFGQAEIASALEMVGEFANQLLAKGALPDLIQVWGVHLPMSEQWGIQGGGEISYTEGDFKKGSGDKYPFIKPKIRMELVELPSDPKPVTVTLKKIVIHENGDNFNGEVFIHTRAFDGLNPSSELKFGTWSQSDGSTRNLNRVIYETEAVGPYLYVEIDVWDEDSPDVGDDNELLGVATWKFGPPYYGSNIHDSQCAGELARRVRTPSGDITVCIGIESP